MDNKQASIKIVTTLKQVMKIFKKKIHKQFRDIDVTGPQGMLMGMLHHFGQMKISDLSKKLGLSNSTVSGIVDRLEKQGFVQRIRSEKDRRIVYVSITEEHKNNYEKHFKIIENNLHEVINNANNDELQVILKGLTTLKEVLERNPETKEDN